MNRVNIQATLDINIPNAKREAVIEALAMASAKLGAIIGAEPVSSIVYSKDTQSSTLTILISHDKP